jgi:triacylglycerol lipase
MSDPFHMFPHAGRLNAHNAHALALAAELVYEDAPLVEAVVLGRWGFQRVVFINEDHTQAFVATNDQMTIVAFRGTEPQSLADWMTDAQSSLVAGPMGGKVHAGFYWSLAEVWKYVNDCVHDYDPQRSKPLWVTGHSLGGALAALAVARWLTAGRPVQGMYTFGQPRTGDSLFARNFNFAFRPHAFRFVNNNDLVTRIPPQTLGYSHLGTFKYFLEDGQFAEGIGWWNRFLDGWRGRIDSLMAGQLDGIDDHSMIHYRSRLANLLPPLKQMPAESLALEPSIPSRSLHHVQPRRRSA